MIVTPEKNSTPEAIERTAPTPEVSKPLTPAEKLAQETARKEGELSATARSKVDALTADMALGKLDEEDPAQTKKEAEELLKTTTEKEGSGSPLVDAIKDLIESIASIFEKDPDKKKKGKSKGEKEEEQEKEWPNKEYTPLDEDAPLWSVPEGVTTTLTSIKGPRNAPVTNQGHGSSDHKGNDIAMPERTPILLTAARAVVKYVKTQAEGAGHYMVLELEDGSLAYFMHLSQEPPFAPGTILDRGDVIALSGNSGNSSGPHLHFEIRKGGVAVDPQAYLQEPYHNEHEDERRLA